MIIHRLEGSRRILATVAEGLYIKLKWRSRKSFGFYTFEIDEIALNNELGKISKSDITHKFW